MLYQRQDEKFVEAKFHRYQAWNFPLIDEECLGMENVYFFFFINKKKKSYINSLIIEP